LNPEGTSFRVLRLKKTTNDSKSATGRQNWYAPLFALLQKQGKVSVFEAEKAWNVTRKTANQRLKQLCKKGLLIEVSQGPFDPHKVFIASKHG
jgi:Fic family protein